MTENNSQIRDEPDYSLANIAEWGGSSGSRIEARRPSGDAFQ